MQRNEKKFIIKMIKVLKQVHKESECNLNKNLSENQLKKKGNPCEGE